MKFCPNTDYSDLLNSLDTTMGELEELAEQYRIYGQHKQEKQVYDFVNKLANQFHKIDKFRLKNEANMDNRKSD